MSEKEEIIAQLNEMAEKFSNEYGELLCLRANIAVINKMLIDRGRGEEFLGIFEQKIGEFKKR
jgi:hypothetical protein